MDAGTLYDAIAEICPVISTTVGKADDRSTWSFVPGENATQAQIDAGNNVIATLGCCAPAHDFVPCGLQMIADRID